MLTLLHILLHILTVASVMVMLLTLSGILLQPSLLFFNQYRSQSNGVLARNNYSENAHHVHFLFSDDSAFL